MINNVNIFVLSESFLLNVINILLKIYENVTKVPARSSKFRVYLER